jgi:cell division protein FtsN
MRKKNKKVPPAKKPILVLSRRAIAGWLVAIFFVCAWMFATGVLVGRGTSPLKFDINELQKKLQIATQELKKKEQRQTRGKPDSGKEKPELEFYEELKKNREDAEISARPSPPPLEIKKDPPASKPSYPKKFSMKRQTKTKKQGTAQVESPNKEPADKSGPQASPPPKKAEPDTKPYTIQVAAFKAAGDASELVAKLKQKGFAAYSKFDKIPNKGIWYRVRVGEYNNKAEAGSTMAKLKKTGQEAILVRK